MGQILHGSATTREAIRRAIQNSQESLRTLAARYGINQKTVAKWRKRTSVADLPTGPRDVKSTVPTRKRAALEGCSVDIVLIFIVLGPPLGAKIRWRAAGYPSKELGQIAGLAKAQAVGDGIQRLIAVGDPAPDLQHQACVDHGLGAATLGGQTGPRQGSLGIAQLVGIVSHAPPLQKSSVHQSPEVAQHVLLAGCLFCKFGLRGGPIQMQGNQKRIEPFAQQVRQQRLPVMASGVAFDGGAGGKELFLRGGREDRGDMPVQLRQDLPQGRQGVRQNEVFGHDKCDAVHVAGQLELMAGSCPHHDQGAGQDDMGFKVKDMLTNTLGIQQKHRELRPLDRSQMRSTRCPPNAVQRHRLDWRAMR